MFLLLELSIMNFTSLVYSENAVNNGLSIADVNCIYHANDKNLQIKCVLLNTSSDNITVLTDHLSTDFLKDSKKYVIWVDSMTEQYQGYNIVESIYKFAPVTLKPKEGTFINHIVKRTTKRINKDTIFIVRYEIREEFGKRFDLWHGAIESGPIKPKKIK